MSVQVVIPTFNCSDIVAGNIPALLEKIARLGDLLSGVTFVDDGSTDTTRQELERIVARHPYCSLIVKERNEGPGVARDSALAASDARWVWFVDSDDQIDLDGLEALRSRLADCPEEVDVVGHGLTNTYDEDDARGLVTEIMRFRERQEVFNFVFSRRLLIEENIRFASGVHEDIRYLFEALSKARRVTVLSNTKVIVKVARAGSITSKLSAERVVGYLRAAREIIDLVASDTRCAAFAAAVPDLVVGAVGVILYLASREDDARHYGLLAEHLDALDLATRLPTRHGPNSTNFLYATSRYAKGKASSEPVADLHAAIREIFASRLSCVDLEHSLFLAPDEIRACCKRFFVGGQRKGDVVLLHANEDVTYQAITRKKDELVRQINRGEDGVCSGCPYIRRFPTAGDRSIQYISLENFNYCNMRCTYCSPTYYGGKEAEYDAAAIVGAAEKSGALAQDCHIVWGGGEPTLSPRFHDVTDTLLASSHVGVVRVLTNSLRHSDDLETFLGDDRVRIVTSIDAGTQPVFETIRGRGTIDAVFANLAKYHAAARDPRRITIKYILCEDNCDSAQLAAFVDLVVAHGLGDSYFHVSCDFRLERAGTAIMLAIYELSARLFRAGCRRVFLDDMIRDRLTIDGEAAGRIAAHLATSGLTTDDVVAGGGDERFDLWGAGLQAAWITGKTTAGRAGRVRSVLTADAARGRDGADPTPIVPTAVQRLLDVEREIEACGHGSRIAYKVFY